jgi:uncharacterized protein
MRMPKLAVQRLAAAALFLGSVAQAAAGLAASAPVPPKPERYVTDTAGLLPPERAAAMNEKLAAFERETSAQVLVWIAPKVPEGTTPEELGAEAIRKWGVGQKGKDNGLVFFVFPEDRKMRIATGYGLEGAIPDAVAKRIQSETVKPFFLKGDFAGGVEAGVDARLLAARGEGTKGSGRTVAESGGKAEGAWRVLRWAIWAALAAVFVASYVFRSFGPGVLGVLGGFAAVFVPLAAFDSDRILGPAVLLAFGSVGGLILAAARQTPGPAFHRSRGSGGSESGSSGSSSSSSSDSSDSSSSSSSFSGGGGDSGGGGSSESW